MNARRRTIPDGLPNRVYAKSGSYYWFPKGGSWIKLCRVEDGEPKMLERLAAEKRKNETGGTGDMPHRIDEYMKAEGGKLKDKSTPYHALYAKKGFADVNVSQVDTAYVADFIEQNWSGKPHMQHIMRAFLRGFFTWCKRKRYFDAENPCSDMKLDRRPKRDVYISHEHFGMIRANLAKHPMMVCMVDLCYLTAQRSTEIRALLWKKEGEDSSWVDRENGLIHFKPSKTSESSGAAVDWRITPDIEEVLERARSTGKIKSHLVIHTRNGKAYTPHTALYHWREACNKAKLEQYSYTIKDIRAKALTDAQRAGYDLKAIMEAAAHTKQSTTETYFKQKAVPVSEIDLKLPKMA